MRPPEPRDGAGRVQARPTATTKTATKTIHPDGRPSRYHPWVAQCPRCRAAAILPGPESGWLERIVHRPDCRHVEPTQPVPAIGSHRREAVQ